MLLVAVIAGIFLGVLCDGLFILRLIFRDPRACSSCRRQGAPAVQSDRRVSTGGYIILRGFCDFLSVFLAVVILMLLCYYTSDGQLRAPAIFGMIAGFWGYHITVSRLMRRLSAILLDVVWRALRFVWSHTVGGAMHAIASTLRKQYRNVVTVRRIDKLTQASADGFGIMKNSTDEKEPDIQSITVSKRKGAPHAEQRP